MARVVIIKRMEQRVDTAANWTAKNPILGNAEIGIQSASVPEEIKMKVGDGVTRWVDLPYFADAPPGGSSTPRVQVINSTPGGAASCDWSLYDDIRIKLTEPLVTVTFSGAVDGQVCRLKLAQDASGSRSVAMPPEIRYNDMYPSFGASFDPNRADVLQFRFDLAEASYDLFSVIRNLNTAGAGSVSEISTGITWTQSSVYSGLAATSGNMRDANSSSATGAATGAATGNSLATEYVRADLGFARAVSRVTVGGGSLPTWGAIAFYLNGALIQYSLDGSTSWTTVATVSGVTNTGTLDKDFNFPAVSARYWRISKGGYLATATFKLYG